MELSSILMARWASSNVRPRCTMRYRQLAARQLDLSYLDSPENLKTYQKAMDDPNLGWREFYQAALLELDRDKLLQYIERAENAIREHANLRPDPPHHNPHELQAMQDGLARFKPAAPQALRE